MSVYIRLKALKYELDTKCLSSLSSCYCQTEMAHLYLCCSYMFFCFLSICANAHKNTVHLLLLHVDVCVCERAASLLFIHIWTT